MKIGAILPAVLMATLAVPTALRALPPALLNPAPAAPADPALRRDLTLWLAAIEPRGPGAPPPTGIAHLLDAHKTWPERALLARRLAESLTDLPPGPAQLTLCRDHAPIDPAGLLTCAQAEQTAGNSQNAANLAQRAYIEATLSPEDESALRAAFPTAIGPDQQWARFERLAWLGNPTLARIVPNLTGDPRLTANAWVLLHANDAAAPAALAKLPPDGPWRNAPLLRFEEARAARREGALRDAATLWAGPTGAAELAAPAAHRAAFATERDTTARLLLADGDFAAADATATDPAAPATVAPDLAALRGLIAWDHADLATAASHFQAMAKLSPGIVTQGRALWWQGVTAARANNATAARAAFAQAARYPTNFYGQAAIVALGDAAKLPAMLAALRDPPTDTATAQIFDASDLAHAAAILADMNERHHAALFIERAADQAATPPALAYAAARARALNLPEAAVQIARMAGRLGIALPQTGWPSPCIPPPNAVPTALALGIMRQESSFDPAVQSSAGAIGLMQLLPATAAGVARDIHASFKPGMLVDPATNMTLGTAYLGQLLSKFGGIAPYAIAAYNAGPHRVQSWLQTTPTPPADLNGVAFWVDHIPAAETRGYVARVLESSTIYNKGTLLPLGLPGAAGN